MPAERYISEGLVQRAISLRILASMMDFMELMDGYGFVRSAKGITSKIDVITKCH